MTHNEFIKIYGECPFRMVAQGHAFTDLEILRITASNNNHYWTVAHEMAKYGIFFLDQDIQLLGSNTKLDQTKTLDGLTVAHWMAVHGYNQFSNDMLELKFIDHDGKIPTLKELILNSVKYRRTRCLTINEHGNIIKED